MGEIFIYQLKKIKISDIEIINAAFVSSRFLGSIVRSKCIGHNMYIDISRNLCSKPTPIYVPVHKPGFNLSYYRMHFSRLPQEYSKILINFCSKISSYTYMMIDPVNNIFIPSEVRIHCHIFDNSIITFGKKCF